ncbi:formylglycine-generating enzyme family protein [Reinekea sp. G2M2-21]|uniref:formylglycine-generating enzyme family protein n=1 Tax=Reinekea sp. G2M2-21 TaxID=2788942 RepID=UPI0018AC0149|nr:formylglycine-generating enzyme family protein [Reinekea sp. G2M2-21]
MKTAFFIHIALAAIFFVSGCQGNAPEAPLTEREIAEKAALGDETELMLIAEVHKILDAPAPSKTEKQAIAQRALDNMVRIDGGEFIMGVSPERLGGDWEGWKPVDGKRQTASIRDTAFHEHLVRLDTYYISKYETTYEDFDAFKRDTGRDFRFANPEMNARYKSYTNSLHKCCRAPRKPAAADWYEADAYCKWLGDISGQPVSLLTEAQWEYAARERGKWLMFATKWGGVGRLTNRTSKATTEVDALSHSMNDLGLYFMSGNLSEWVLDWYAPDYYQHSPVDNPVNDNSPATVTIGVRGQDKGYAKVHRGGGSVFRLFHGG